MAEIREEVTRNIFPAGYRLGRPQDGVGERRLHFAVYDEDMKPLADRVVTIASNGEIRDEAGNLKATDATIVQKLEEVEVLMGVQIATLFGP